MLEHLNQTEQAPERAVVMGAGGFVGGAILRKLKQRGVATLAITRSEIDLLAAGAGDRLAAMLRPSDAFVAVSAIAPCTTPARLRDITCSRLGPISVFRARPMAGARLRSISADAPRTPAALTSLAIDA